MKIEIKAVGSAVREHTPERKMLGYAPTILIDEEIVWRGLAIHPIQDAAERAARDFVVTRFKALFNDTD